MRSLSLVFLIISASASAGEFSSGYSYTSQSGSTGLPLPGHPKFSESKFNIGIKNKYRRIELESTLSHSSRRYTGYNLSTEKNDPVPLKADPAEYLHSIQATYPSTYAISLGTSGHITESVFMTRAYNVSVDRTFYESGLSTKFAATRTENSAPLDYYTDPVTLVRKPRPRLISTTHLQLAFNQILTENLRALIELSTSSRPDDRPTAYGARVGSALALTDRILTQVHISSLAEQRSEALKDERGHFDIKSIEGKISYDASFSTLVALSLGSVIESESSTPLSPAQTVGTDIIGLHWQYRFGPRIVKLDLQRSESNTKQTNFAASGSLTWEI